MIEFTDLTIIEYDGDFEKIALIMKQEGCKEWMLRSKCVILTPQIVSSYTLHFWQNGDVYIYDTTRPPDQELPTDDLVFLKEWVLEKKWKTLIAHHNFLDDPRWWDFWKHCFRMGLIYNKIADFEKDEMIRQGVSE